MPPISENINKSGSIKEKKLVNGSNETEQIINNKLNSDIETGKDTELRINDGGVNKLLVKKTTSSLEKQSHISGNEFKHTTLFTKEDKNELKKIEQTGHSDASDLQSGVTSNMQGCASKKFLCTNTTSEIFSDNQNKKVVSFPGEANSKFINNNNENFIEVKDKLCNDLKSEINCEQIRIGKQIYHY